MHLRLLPLALFLALRTACGEAAEAVQGTQQAVQLSGATKRAAPELELVVARYNEDAGTLAWLSEVPEFYQITIVNKVGHTACSRTLNSARPLLATASAGTLHVRSAFTDRNSKVSTPKQAMTLPSLDFVR